MAEDLHQLEEWFGRILAGLEPGPRRRAALKLGQALRRANLDRIAANVDADGGAFPTRKPRFDRKHKARRLPKRMFRGLRKLKAWKLIADADGIELTPINPLVDRVASVSQFGEEATVGRLRNGQRIRVRYQERRLLGFSDEDRQLAVDVAAEMLDQSPGRR